MEVSILSEREQVYRSSDTPTIEKKVEIPAEREVSYYKSSDPKADCDNFVDMYEEDYVLEDEIGINLPLVSKCPTKYFAVENLFGELEHVYQKEKAQENLGIKHILNGVELLVKDLQNQILTLQKQALTDIVISEGIIQEQQYQGYKVLKSVDATVTSIGNSAFKDCAQLETFICRTTTPPSLGSDVFTNTNSQLAIYVPTSNLATYKTNWSVYKDIIVPMNYYTTLGIFPYTGTFIESGFLQLYAKKEGKNVEVTWEIISGSGTITNEGILRPGSSNSPITVRATMKDGTYLESIYTPGVSVINELEE